MRPHDERSSDAWGWGEGISHDLAPPRRPSALMLCAWALWAVLAAWAVYAVLLA